MIASCLLLIGIPLIVFGGAMLFQEKHYAWISLCVAVLSCLPLFLCFERRDSTAKELMTLSVLVAASAAGRFAFAWVPGFKPVTAVTVIAAMYLGREAGFVVGSLSAVVSNFYFGQGPWTPFQMFAWGILGFLAGVLAQPLKRRKVWMCLYGVLAGVLCMYLSAEKKIPPVQLAARGVFVHGLAGDRAAEVCGKRGMTARDIIRFLPEILRIKDDMDDGKM